MDKRIKQETLISKLIDDSPEQKHWLDPSYLDQDKLNKYEQNIWKGIKNKSIIQIGRMETLHDAELFRIIGTVPQTTSLETLNKIHNDGFTIQFVFPKLDTEAISDNDGSLMAEMITVRYQPTTQ